MLDCFFKKGKSQFFPQISQSRSYRLNLYPITIIMINVLEKGNYHLIQLSPI